MKLTSHLPSADREQVEGRLRSNLIAWLTTVRPRLRELLIDLVSKGSYQLVVNLDKVGFLDSTGLGVLVGA